MLRCLRNLDRNSFKDFEELINQFSYEIKMTFEKQSDNGETMTLEKCHDFLNDVSVIISYDCETA